MKTCSKCLRWLPLDAFTPHASMGDGYRPECRLCVAAYNRWYRANNADALRRWEAERHSPDRALAVRLRRYRMTVEDLQRMEAEQGGECAICWAPPPLDVDHDHACCPGDGQTCGHCVRGLLCRSCNVRLTTAYIAAGQLTQREEAYLAFSTA